MSDLAAVPAGEVEDTPPRTLGSMIDELYALKLEAAEYESKAKKIKEIMEGLKNQIILGLDAQETTIGAGGTAKVSITMTEIPKVDDWSDFYDYINENQAYHLLQRRPATTACREMLDSGETIPGMSIFNKRDISLRKK